MCDISGPDTGAGDALVSLATNLLFLSEEIASSGGVTAAQWAVMHHLGVAGPGGLSPSEIALITRTTRPNVTKIVARLQRGGYVEAEASIVDGRRRQVRLTGKGKQVLARMNAEKARRVDIAMSALTDADKDAFRRIVDRLVENLRPAAQPQPSNIAVRGPCEPVGQKGDLR